MEIRAGRFVAAIYESDLEFGLLRSRRGDVDSAEPIHAAKFARPLRGVGPLGIFL